MMTTISRTLEVWNEIRGHDSVPYRSRLDPGQIGTIATNLAIAESVSPGHARFRVAGRRIELLARFTLTGMSVLTVFDREHRNSAQAAFNKTIITSAPVLIYGELTSFKQDHIPFEMILLPMRSDMGAIDRILIAVDWTQSVETALFKITRMETLDVAKTSGIPEPLKVFEGTAQAATERRRGHLRLVHSSEG